MKLKSKMRRHTAAVLMLLPVAGCKNSTTVTEVTCKPPPSASSGKAWLLNASYNCAYGFEVGGDLRLTVNESQGTVLLEIVNNRDGQWWASRLFLDGCKIIDAGNWECSKPWGEASGAFKPTVATPPIVQVRGMARGVYYSSLTGGGPYSEDYYHSSLVGIAGYLFRWGVIDAETAATLQSRLMV